jgi:hypothetical protein
MKIKLFLTGIFSLVLAFGLQAQLLDQGNFVIGATMGLSTADSKITHSTGNVDEEGEGPSSLQLSFAPKVGYFVLENFALGIGADFTFSSLKEPNEDRTDDTDLLFGPYGRAYLPVGDDMAFFLEADFGFGFSSDDQYVGDDLRSINTNVFALGIGPGFTIFSNESIGIEALFKYNFAQSKFNTEAGGIKTTTKTTTNQFDIGIGLQFYFGGVEKAKASW